MARRKRIIIDGPIAEAVEQLAESAGVSLAELIKRALRLEIQAQRATSPASTPSAEVFESAPVNPQTQRPYAVYLGRDGAVCLATKDAGAVFRKVPRPRDSDFAGLVEYLSWQEMIFDQFIDPRDAGNWAPGPENWPSVSAFLSSASIDDIKNTIEHYLNVAGFADEPDGKNAVPDGSEISSREAGLL